MRNFIFAVVFILLVFFGFRYLDAKMNEPISEVNMTDEEAEKYLEELNSISGEGLHETAMTTLKECFNMAEANNSYTCLGTMINDESFISSEGLDANTKGKKLYETFGKGKSIIETKYERLSDSTDDLGIYRVSFTLLQESESEIYNFAIEANEITRVEKGE